VVQFLTAPIGVAADALSFLGSALSLGLIRKREPPPAQSAPQSILAALREGFSFMRRQPLVRAFTGCNATFMFFFTVTQAVLLLFFTRHLHLKPVIIGLIFAAGDVGGLLGATIAGRLGKTLAPGPTIMGSAFLRAFGLSCMPLAALAPSVAVPVLLVSQIMQAFGWAIWGVNQGSTRQLLVPDRLRGRVNGSFLFLVRGVTSLGGFAGGVLAGGAGVVPTLVIGATGSLLGIGWLLASPLWSLREQPMPTDGRSVTDSPQ
jgi:MFS family permease